LPPRLAAIAVIRTALNYFLSREMQEPQGDGQAQTYVPVHVGPVLKTSAAN
jgi:hypothetical protein